MYGDKNKVKIELMIEKPNSQNLMVKLAAKTWRTQRHARMACEQNGFPEREVVTTHTSKKLRHRTGR